MGLPEMIPLSPRDDWTVERGVAAVSASLTGIRRLGVAFSGGVDSSLLLALSARVLGAGQVLALLGVSPSLASDERAAAHTVAGEIGAPVVEIATFDGEDASY